MLRADALLVPKVSWTEASAPAAVTYGALVGTPNVIVLVPRGGTETAGFTLSLQWVQGAATLDDISRLVGDPSQPIANIEAALQQSLPQWTTRCVFPVTQLSRFEILSGWKLWLGVSAILQVGGESPMSVRVPDKSHLQEMRQMYGR